MPKTVLIVEDYEDTRELIKFMLEVLGLDVLEAADGQQAVDCTKTKHPDLILMDISMPVMDGIVATRIIRTLVDAGGANVPIVCLTAHGSSYGKEALAAGCNEVVSKPVDFETLKPIVSQYL